MTLDYKHKIEVRNIIEGIRELSLDQLDLFYNLLASNEKDLASRIMFNLGCALQNTEEKRISQHNKREGERIKKELKHG